MISHRSLAWVRPILCCLLLLVVCLDAVAMWARMSESELLERSDLVVSGTLIGHSPVRTAGEDMVLAVIRIDTVYKGAAGQLVAFLVLPAADRPLSSSDLHYRVGQSGLWFLRQRSAAERGLFLADHPQRFTPSASASAQIEFLQKRLPK
ncbi:MAG: hypothetical protein ABTR92_19360 [Candidatus Accumulibacter phosphatis]|uniref:hypothetical protein n=1 Tax=Candidatus Accumulibacter sp. ACC012 TaxID=2823332 RepID=UPI0025C4E575|nr:hypothetical protein [Candidatus Accumulibacter sp. ACC012]